MTDVAGLDELEQLERRLEALAGAPARAARRVVGPLLQLAHGEWSAGQSADGDPWDPLKGGGGTPLTDLTSKVTGHADGNAAIITTPDELRYHQGGFYVHTGAAGDRLREAQAAARTAKANADKERLKIARADVRRIKKVIRTEATHVVARRTLPRSGRALPVEWGRVVAKALEDEVTATLQGASS